MPQSQALYLDRVSTARGSGWVNQSDSNQQQYRMLSFDPPATAGGTDPVQQRFPY